jgi:hypothetical protein
MTRVWDLDLPDSDKIVLLALADCANDEGHCWPSVASLVRKCTKSERTIQSSIKRLVDEGLLLRREVPGKGCNYTVLPKTTAAVAPRSRSTGETTAPAQRTPPTPAAVADKPLNNHQTGDKSPELRVIEAWNEGGALIECKVLDNSRKQMLRLRLKSHGLATMLEAVRLAKASTFLRGEKGDGRKADINIILQPKTLARVLEGFYGEDESRPMTPAKQVEQLRRMISRYEEWGRPEDAEECRRRISALEAGPSGDAAVSVGSAAQKIMEGVRLQ